MLTIDEALQLKRGSLLRFGGLFIFEVISVEARAKGVYIMLKRDDGYRTFATEEDLQKAVIVRLPGDSAIRRKDALTIADTREVEALKWEGDDYPSPTEDDE